MVSEDTGFEGNLVSEVTEDAKVVLTYEEGNHIAGFAYVTLSNSEGHGKEANLKLYVTASKRRKGIGTELYNALSRQLEKENLNVLVAYMRVDEEDPSSFCKKFGFNKWWGSPELIFRGEPFRNSDLDFHQYEDMYYEQYRTIKNECYYEIQRSNDLKPYELSYSNEERKGLLNNSGNTYLVLNKDEVVASVTIGVGEIDNLMVSPGYQGNGYGKKCLQFAINKMLDNGYEEIRICYMEGNDSAEKLYYSLGFKPLQLTHVYRKIL
ncbi:GNAT family N-acetyltransferase [Virgibacillus flavescens]|uniref:GNAT family N-acetyltransferase n=1 Tax=Virgibacillus flavescens TaxID=1611422 RepID=UPI003D3444F8